MEPKALNNSLNYSGSQGGLWLGLEDEKAAFPPLWLSSDASIPVIF